MTASRLAALLDQMEPGPWSASPAAWESVRNSSIPLNEPDARLVALAPDMARLLVDTFAEHWEDIDPELRSRFAALDEKAGGA